MGCRRETVAAGRTPARRGRQADLAATVHRGAGFLQAACAVVRVCLRALAGRRRPATRRRQEPTMTNASVTGFEAPAALRAVSVAV
jgi:cytochrome b561